MKKTFCVAIFVAIFMFLTAVCMGAPAPKGVAAPPPAAGQVSPGKPDIKMAPARTVSGVLLVAERESKVGAECSFGFGGYERYNCCISLPGSVVGSQHAANPLNIFYASKYVSGGIEICNAIKNTFECQIRLKYKAKPWKTVESIGGEADDLWNYLKDEFFDEIGLVIDRGRMNVIVSADGIEGYNLDAGATDLRRLEADLLWPARTNEGKKLHTREVNLHKIVSVEDVSDCPSD